VGPAPLHESGNDNRSRAAPAGLRRVEGGLTPGGSEGVHAICSAACICSSIFLLMMRSMASYAAAWESRNIDLQPRRPHQEEGEQSIRGLRTGDCRLRTGDCGLGTGDCGLGTGDWNLGVLEYRRAAQTAQPRRNQAEGGS